MGRHTVQPIDYPVLVANASGPVLYQRRDLSAVVTWSARYNSSRYQPDASRSSVWWEADEAWFDQRVAWVIENAPELRVTRPRTKYLPAEPWIISGCCPAAVQMWPESHGAPAPATPHEVTCAAQTHL